MQRVARGEQVGAGWPSGVDVVGVERHPLVPGGDRTGRGLANAGGDIRHLVAAVLASGDAPAERA